MSYAYKIDPQAMFDDRTHQFENFGIPSGDIEKVRAAVTEHLAKLPFGMHDILGNAMGWDHSPTLDELSVGLEKLSRRELLAQPSNSPMLVISTAPMTTS